MSNKHFSRKAQWGEEVSLANEGLEKGETEKSNTRASKSPSRSKRNSGQGIRGGGAQRYLKQAGCMPNPTWAIPITKDIGTQEKKKKPRIRTEPTQGRQFRQFVPQQGHREQLEGRGRRRGKTMLRNNEPPLALAGGGHIKKARKLPEPHTALFKRAECGLACLTNLNPE